MTAPPDVTGPIVRDAGEWIETLLGRAAALQPELVAFRRHLHRHPELSGHEQQTTEYIAGELRQHELPVHFAEQRCGLTCDLIWPGTAADLPLVALRGDIDALPITDAKAVDYRSSCDGVMHACGHDAHAAVIYGALRIVSDLASQRQLPWPVAVRGIFQPAEETATGAKQMIRQHALRNVQSILALHVDPTRSVGSVGLRYGTLTAAADMFRVVCKGRGGHGARPHLTADPIDAATRWVQSAYRRVTRAIDAHQTVVISVGRLEAGHSANVIPDTALLEGTLRTLGAAARARALEILEDLCEAVGRETGCQVELTLGMSAPAVVNHDDAVGLLQAAVIRCLGAGAIERIDQPSMGSEDFSYYLEQVPGAMMRLGVAGEQVGRAPLHTPLFDLDERALSIGASVLATAAILSFSTDRPRPPIPDPSEAP